MAERGGGRPPDDDLTPSTDEFGRTEPDVLKREARRIERERRRVVQEQLGEQASGKKRKSRRSKPPRQARASAEAAAADQADQAALSAQAARAQEAAQAPQAAERTPAPKRDRRRKVARDSEPVADPGRPRRAKLPPRGPNGPEGPGGPGAGPTKSFRRRRALGFAGVAVGVLLLWFLIALFQPFAGAGEGSGRVVVQIPKGATAGDVADILDSADVISSGALFELRLKFAGKTGQILPGTYSLAEGMSYGTAIDRLTSSSNEGLVRLTVPEGLNRAQIGKLTESTGLEGDYAAETESGEPYGFDPAKYGAKKGANLEGFLFPATYELDPKASVNDLIQMQLDAFQRSIKTVDMKHAKKKNLTVFDVVTIASIIEREAAQAKERPLVAAVIYNRLHAGMTLGMDSTTRFATGNYTQPLTNEQLGSNSPYNTRKAGGLPPGPIGNPGLASIEAAANPAKVDYLFFVVKPGTCGEMVFQSNEAAFNRARDQYNAARAAAGGNSPDTCAE